MADLTQLPISEVMDALKNPESENELLTGEALQKAIKPLFQKRLDGVANHVKENLEDLIRKEIGEEKRKEGTRLKAEEMEKWWKVKLGTEFQSDKKGTEFMQDAFRFLDKKEPTKVEKELTISALEEMLAEGNPEVVRFRDGIQSASKSEIERLTTEFAEYKAAKDNEAITMALFRANGEELRKIAGKRLGEKEEEVNKKIAFFNKAAVNVREWKLDENGQLVHVDPETGKARLNAEYKVMTHSDWVRANNPYGVQEFDPGKNTPPPPGGGGAPQGVTYKFKDMADYLQQYQTPGLSSDVKKKMYEDWKVQQAA